MNVAEHPFPKAIEIGFFFIIFGEWPMNKTILTEENEPIPGFCVRIE